jgi:hypothetical protein
MVFFQRELGLSFLFMNGDSLTLIIELTRSVINYLLFHYDLVKIKKQSTWVTCLVLLVLKKKH